MTTKTMKTGADPLTLTPPTMTSPVEGRAYSSPVTVSGRAMQSEGSTEYEATFYDPYQPVENTIPEDMSIQFNQDLSPGPKKLDIRTAFYLEFPYLPFWSDWRHIGWFYVRTPPVD
ncbi:hypothetical protein D3C76_839540 [compost metagenome]